MSNKLGKTAERNKPNYVYSIISIALVLFLTGFFCMILLQAQRLIVVFKERVNILIELQEDNTSEEKEQLQAFLAQSDFIKEGSVRYISRDEAARIMQEEFGEDFLKLDLPNPFYDIYSFNVKANYMQADSLLQLQSEISALPYVKDVYYQENLISEVANNVRRIGYLALGLGLFFIFVAITLIHNTVRLALYANRFLIKNMELVGASWEFISRPYLIRAAIHGLISSVIAIAGLTFLLMGLERLLPELRAISDTFSLVLLYAGLIVLGIMINTASTYAVVKKYLRMRLDDLF